VSLLRRQRVRIERAVVDAIRDQFGAEVQVELLTPIRPLGDPDAVPMFVALHRESGRYAQCVFDPRLPARAFAFSLWEGLTRDGPISSPVEASEPETLYDIWRRMVTDELDRPTILDKLRDRKEQPQS
jgi:hypothetical protein